MRALRLAGWLGLAAALGCGDDGSVADDGGIVDATVPPDLRPRVDSGPPPPPLAEPGRHAVELVETRRVVPSDGLPPETEALNSNNNLDVVRFEDRVFLAWRTSPDHFAGPETVMHIVSSTDELSWVHEATFALGTDVREPAFLVHEGALYFYLSVLGVDRFSFDPMGVRWSRRDGLGDWTALEELPATTGYIAWATKSLGGVSYMTAYEGGEHIYTFDGMPLFVELRTSSDGVDWQPLTPAGSPEQTWVYTGGGSEMDFAFADDGTLHAVIRNEAGDGTGWGSLVCAAPAGDIAAWDCVNDPKKYDSPHVFAHDGEIYLFGRRHLSETGDYDVATHITDDPQQRTVQNQIAYVGAPKRCALWRFVQGEQRIAYLLDLPSRGDTCFAATMTTDDPETIVVYDYSSDIDGEDVGWSEGQRGPTYIYRHVLRFVPRGE